MQFLKILRVFKVIRLIFILLVGFSALNLTAQTRVFTKKLDWKSAGISFEGAVFRNSLPSIPVFEDVIEIENRSISSIKIIPITETKLSETSNIKPNQVESDYQLSYHIGIKRGIPCLIYQIVPLKKQGNALSKLENFDLQINYSAKGEDISQRKKPVFAANSVLGSGEWLKIGTLQNGVYRIDYANLKSFGLNPESIDPRNIKIFGHGAGMLPQNNDAQRIDDLEELSITVQGEADGKFNPGDFILFYGESQINQWQYNQTNKNYSFVSNLYCDTTYYFLTFGNNAGKRITKTPSQPNENATVNSYTYLTFYNNEKTNLIKSGKVWVGEEFDRITQQSFNVSIPNLITTEPIKFRSSVTARSFVPSEFQVNANGKNILTQMMDFVTPGYERPYTNGLTIDATSFLSNTANFTINYQYNKPSSGSIGWLDFFEIQAKVELKNLAGNFVFKDASNVGTGNITKYQIGSNRNLTVLDVSNPLQPIQIEGNFTNNTFSFSTNTDTLKTFAAYDGSNYLQVTNFGKIANQNLHALSNPDGFIITHPLFLKEAKRLAEHHTKKSGMVIHVVNIQEIYNEFSAGTADLCAVRDFLRMFYKRASTPAQMPKYVALFGRASYDYKYRQNPNSNYIPTFESWESFSPTNSYCSDDFLGFLDDNEGKWDQTNLAELLDIGIGRFPVTNETEAAEVVNKVIAYESASSFGSWRNNLVFVADDEDNNTHQTQSDVRANFLLERYPDFNIQKIYLDAYKKESTAGGARFPEAQKAINQSIQKGCLIFNYTGHGGEVGLTAERVLGLDDIQKWTNGSAENGYKLPLFMTATCEFSRFDDPSRYAAGEQTLLNPIGGAIALFTTVRLVYSGQNEALNEKFYQNTGFDSASKANPPKLGDIIRNTKNAYTDPNTRNFTLLGDPFLTLAYPTFKVETTQINSKDISIFSDTLKALKKFEVEGKITDRNGTTLSDFEGTVYPVIFDKFSTYSTMGNTPSTGSPMAFSMQNNVLYRGKSSVKNGLFKFSFVVPKDISYEYGFGKISYYANSSKEDAAGFSNKVIIGGTSDSTFSDNKGPELKLYLNDEKFVNGGTTNQNPKLLVKLYDESGINTTGRGIGRDLLLVLDNNQTQAVSVNDFYQATLNTYQSGEVNYSLANLSAGKHQLKFRAYDVYNNLSEASLDFEVKSSDKPTIDHLLNYPNPFNNLTTFHFDHNLTGQNLQVMISIYTISGKLVKTLRAESNGDGSHFDQIQWDGKDDYGDKLANGVYIYQCKVKPGDSKSVEKIEKLVILN